MKREEFAGLLGVAGLIPFVGLSLVTTSPDPARASFAVQAITAYAAVILSFVGAIHWGVLLATPNYRLERRGNWRYLWSVIPALMAWPMLLLPSDWALLGLTLGLFLAWAVDQPMYREQGNLTWFMRLRLFLTVCACLSLLFAWWNLK